METSYAQAHLRVESEMRRAFTRVNITSYHSVQLLSQTDTVLPRTATDNVLPHIEAAFSTSHFFENHHTI